MGSNLIFEDRIIVIKNILTNIIRMVLYTTKAVAFVTSVCFRKFKVRETLAESVICEIITERIAANSEIISNFLKALIFKASLEYV